jgi:hypothetical protein
MTTSAVQEYKTYMRVEKYGRHVLSRRYFSKHIKEWYTKNDLTVPQQLLEQLDGQWYMVHNGTALDVLISQLVQDPNFRKCVEDFGQSELNV